MAVSQVWVLHGVQTPNNFYSQITGHRNTPGLDAMVQTGAGFPAPLYRGVLGAKPMLTFTTTQVATLLGECGIFGCDLSGGNVDLYYALLTNKGKRATAASTVHMRFRMNDCYMYWRSLRAGERGRASSEVTICPVFDGTNSPIVATGSVALAGTPSAAESFGLGPVKINGTAYSGIQEASIDLGTRIKQVGDASEPFDTFIGNESIDPVFSANGVNPAAWTTYGLAGNNCTALAMYLRKRNLDASGGAAYVADGTAQHILISGTKGLIYLEGSSGGDVKSIDTALKIGLICPDASTDPVILNAASAIT